MITLTELAIKKIKEISDDEDIGHYNLRVKVLGGGCAGFRYDIYFEEKEPTDFDEIFEQKNVTIICDPLSYQYIDGTEIDFKDGLMDSGFAFKNPKMTRSCGCGNSFSL